MRRLWVSDNWEKYLGSDARTGIRLRFDVDVDPEVKRACKKFVKWLRTEYQFPMRVPIYIKSKKQIKSKTGEMASAIFFGPFDKDLEPYIRVAAGDYEDMLKERDKDDALGAILQSIIHELTHYFQWIKDIDFLEIQQERQAKYYAREIIYDYADIEEHL